jgi:sporulation protein YlmC with PRC-barrel domain
MRREVQLERLVGQKVLDPQGRSIGRLEEVRVERQGEDYVVTAYLIGTTALFERLSLGAVQRHEGGVLRGYRAAWHQLDLSDPSRPRLRCRVEDLRRLPDERDPPLQDENRQPRAND